MTVTIACQLPPGTESLPAFYVVETRDRYGLLHIAVYDTPQEADEAYDVAKRTLPVANFLMAKLRATDKIIIMDRVRRFLQSDEAKTRFCFPPEAIQEQMDERGAGLRLRGFDQCP